MDFIVWGHEHECLISPQTSAVGGKQSIKWKPMYLEFYITQPGSSVATALSDGESKQKWEFIILNTNILKKGWAPGN